MKTKEEILRENSIQIERLKQELPKLAYHFEQAMQLFADQEVKAAIEKRDTEILEFINKSMFVGFITTESLKKFINNEI